MNHFVNTDALDYLSQLKDNSVDLVFTDPPYIISRKTGFASVKNGEKRFGVSMDFGAWDNAPAVEHYDLMHNCMTEYHRVLRKGGTLVCWYDLWKLQMLAGLAETARFKQLRMIEWLKTNPVPLNSQVNYLTGAREVALVCVKGGKPTFNSKYDNGVYEYPIHRDGGKRLHPTQKPLQLSRDIIAKHSNPGDVVLDTFAGSGTHLVAAQELGRQAWGCEADPKYHQVASERLAVAQEALL